jgi:hypothetical protein
MKAATLSQLKKELNTLPKEELIEVAVKLAKFKKDNKELLSYLLFEQQDENAYINTVKTFVDEQFEGINRSNIYYIKKGLRKILRTINKFIKYSGKKETEIELLIHFCNKFKTLEIPLDNYVALHNMYYRQVQKIKTALKTLHEDVQHDYKEDLEALII